MSTNIAIVGAGAMGVLTGYHQPREWFLLQAWCVPGQAR
jgi:hypothetical protein